MFANISASRYIFMRLVLSCIKISLNQVNSHKLRFIYGELLNDEYYQVNYMYSINSVTEAIVTSIYTQHL